MRTHDEHLAKSFDAACKSGEIDKAAALLAELDVTLLGEELGSAQREGALRRMRQLRTRLEKMRAGREAPVARMARALFG